MKRGNIPTIARENVFQAEGIVSAKALRRDRSVSAKSSRETSVAKVNG